MRSVFVVPKCRANTSRFALLASAVVLGLAIHAAEPVGPRKKAAAVPLKGRLTIDGKLDEPAWRRAPEHSGFEQTLGRQGRRPLPDGAPQTSFRVVYDADAVYFGIRCAEPKMKDLVAKAARHWDAAMWSDDDVEIFLDPVGDRQEFYQFAVNTDGTQTDLYLIERGHTGKDPWSSEWKAAVFKGPDFWSLEVAIPFADLYNRPARMWRENWVFSISRTRKPAPSYFSQYSPGNGYHDVENFGTLGPIRIDRSRFDLYVDAPRFRLSPHAGSYAVRGEIVLENRGANPVQGLLIMDILEPGARDGRTAVALAPGESRRIAIPGGRVAAPGKYPVVFRVVDSEDRPLLLARFDEWLRYEPLTIAITEPNYRNTIYATQTIAKVRGTISVNLSPDSVKNCLVTVGLYAGRKNVSREMEIAAGENIAFELAADFPAGDYTLRAVLRRKHGDAPAILAESAVALRKLPRAPAVEVRVSPGGSLLIDGFPVFIRGWYGSMFYIGSAAAFPRAQLPHSTNFIMGTSPFEQYDLGLYTLKSLCRLVDEKKAKLDQEIDEALKTRLLAAVAETRNQRNVIGYYISDEPECRGLSPYFLQSLYGFLKAHDPYRMVMIVSRAPARYIEACDVICPHPYLNPQAYEDGTRRFASLPKFIGAVIAEAVRANRGGKAVWVMPQTFSYGGLRGRHPTFEESRFFTFSGIAAGARGVVPFIFNGFWNHWENRVAMNHIFETLTFLAPAWTAENAEVEATCDNGAVRVIAKDYCPEKKKQHNVFLVAVNHTYEPQTATIRSPALLRRRVRRLVVLRENRTVSVDKNGSFLDTFARLGVHLYTTVEALPALASLEEIRAEIAAPKLRAAAAGNILAQGRISWRISGKRGGFSSCDDLADGVSDAAGWIPWYGDRTQMVLELAEPVVVRRVVLHSPSLRAVTFQAWIDGAWKDIHRWQDQALERMSWTGGPVTAARFRFTDFALRRSLNGGGLPEITELGLYAK